jgi:hypothetical protein
MDENRVQGACLCGGLSFAALLPSLWCAHCHCSQCQRFHGAAVVTWVGFAADRFQVITGEHSLRWYASSAPAQRGYCGDCGSSLFFRSTKWPNEMHVALANIHGPLDREPEAHVFYGSHVSWLHLADNLPRKV